MLEAAHNLQAVEQKMDSPSVDFLRRIANGKYADVFGDPPKRDTYQSATKWRVVPDERRLASIRVERAGGRWDMGSIWGIGEAPNPFEEAAQQAAENYEGWGARNKGWKNRPINHQDRITLKTLLLVLGAICGGSTGLTLAAKTSQILEKLNNISGDIFAVCTVGALIALLTGLAAVFARNRSARTAIKKAKREIRKRHSGY